MRGNVNHSFMLGSELLQEAVLKDYAIYDLGCFPAIKVENDSTVRGGLYRVPDDEIAAIRMLECEGRMYKETEAGCVVNGKDVKCQAYVYQLPVKEAQRADGTKLWKYQA